MNTPPAVSGRHLPALDGIRAFAIMTVLALHLSLSWLQGGFLGVDLFFVLSGFLITSLLLEEWRSATSIRLTAFWARRARRLLPAVILLLLASGLWAVCNGELWSPSTGGVAVSLPTLRADAIATLLYVNNWHFILFDHFQPSPLGPLWSLSVEEQFYLVWPLVLLAVLGRRRGAWRRTGIIVCAVGALASAVEMSLLYHGGAEGWTRPYYGTDTRACPLLVGALLAFLIVDRPQPARRARAWLHAAGPLAFAGFAALCVIAGSSTVRIQPWMFHGGFLLCALLAMAIIADVRQLHQGPLGKFLSIRPLRWVGRISYSLYLWHWPIFVYLNPGTSGISGIGLDFARLGAAFAAASLSYYLVEQPIRRRRLVRSRAHVRVAIPVATIAVIGTILIGTTPAIAAPMRPWSGGGLDPGRTVDIAGAGGLDDGTPVVLLRHGPLRILTVGDGVMTNALIGVDAALSATGEVRVARRTIASWGLTAWGAAPDLRRYATHARSQLIIASWAEDDAIARTDPRQYQVLLEYSLRTLLAPGDSVAGIVLLQVPVMGPVSPRGVSLATYRAWKARAAGVTEWNAAAQAAAKAFPGRVIYLPVAASVELDGRYASWLPEVRGGGANAQWVRVRAADGVELCPPGITRYGAAVLADLTDLLHLSSTKREWWDGKSIVVKAYNNQVYSYGAGCPDDHPDPRR